MSISFKLENYFIPQLMKNLFLSFISGVILLLFPGLVVLGANSSPEMNPCDGPTTQIKILVAHTAGSSVYKYTVVNNHSHEIRYFILGAGYGREVSSNPENSPSDVRAPQGWSGRRIHTYERPTMIYYWKSTDQQFRIQTGQTLSGFELEMDAPNPTMLELSFRAYADNGLTGCYWGKVELKP